MHVNIAVKTGVVATRELISIGFEVHVVLKFTPTISLKLEVEEVIMWRVHHNIICNRISLDCIHAVQGGTCANVLH